MYVFFRLSLSLGIPLRQVPSVHIILQIFSFSTLCVVHTFLAVLLEYVPLQGLVCISSCALFSLSSVVAAFSPAPHVIVLENI